MENRKNVLCALLMVIGAVQCQTVKYCVPEQQNELCQQMELDVPNVFECVSRPDRLACMKAIRDGEADTINVDAQNIFVGGYYYNLKVLAYEEINRAPFRYSSVAVVKKTLQASSLADLKGKRSCHTGIGRTAGWQIPLSQLQKRGAMDTDCRGEFETVTGFFSASCAPLGILGDPVLHAELRNKYPSLCALCGEPDKCDWSDIYSGYEGALKCLTDERGDVAFSKIEAVETFVKKYPQVVNEYEYLCLDGTRMNISEGAEEVAAGCSWGRRPSNGFVVAETIRQDKKDQIYSAIRQAFSRYSPNIPQIQHQEKPEWFTKIFVSSVNTTDVLVTDTEQQQWNDYLGDFQYAINRFFNCQPDDITFCATSSAAFLKCADLAAATLARRINANVQCVLRDSPAECIEAVKQGIANITTLDGGDIYKAGRYSDLVPIAAEIYEVKQQKQRARYCAVAVLPADSQVTSIQDLRGKRSCHTGIGRTAGWVIPTSTLIEKEQIPADQCDRAAAVSQFFSASCAPGANNPKYNPNLSGADELCQQCIGDETGANKCSRGQDERYSGYAGAFRCLVEGNGDVAFVKDATVPEYTDGNSELDWTSGILSQNFKLLCRNGTTSSIDNYKDCNLACVPSHHVMTSGSATAEERLKLAKVIAGISKYFGPRSLNFNLFKPYNNTADLLFKDSTAKLEIVSLDSTYQDALGHEYFKAVESTDPLVCAQ